MKTLLSLIMLLVSAALNLYAEPFKWTQTNGPTGCVTVQITRDTKGNAYVITEDGNLFINEPGQAKWRFIKESVAQILIDKYDNFYLKSRWSGDLSLYDSHLILINKIRSGSKERYRVLEANNNGDVYVGVNDGKIEDGLYYTSNKGDTWEKLSDEFPWFICFDSTNNALFLDREDYFGLTQDNWKSSQNRELIDSQWPKDIEYNQRYNTWIAQGYDSIYVSSDTGKTWKLATPSFPVWENPMVVAPDGESYIASGNIMWVSHNGGYNWDTLFVNLYDYPLSSFICRENEIICRTYRNIVRYNISTKKLELFNDGLLISRINRIKGDYEGRIFAAVNDIFIAGTSNEGDNWQYFKGNIEPYVEFRDIFVSKNRSIYITAYTSSWKSTNQGNSWTKMYRYFDSDSNNVAVLHSDENDRLYGVSKGLYYSDDGGATWSSLNHPYFNNSNEYAFASYENKLAVTISGTNGDTLLYSEDRGATFRSLPILSQNYSFISSAFNSKGHLYCAIVDSSKKDSLIITTDKGETFTRIQIPFPYVSRIQFDRNDYLYILTGPVLNSIHRIARSTDDGLSWEYIADTNNQNLWANDIYFDDKNQAFLGTVEDGVWKADVIKGIPLENKSNQLSLEISPNPASERANITLGKDEGPAEITIYNQLGEIIFQKQHSEQTREIDIPVAEFPQGAYFVKVSAGGEVSTGKFAVVR